MRTLLTVLMLAANLPAQTRAGKAQFEPNDFDVADGKIEKVEGGLLAVSTREMRATLKAATQQDGEIHVLRTHQTDLTLGEWRGAQSVWDQAAAETRPLSRQISLRFFGIQAEREYGAGERT